MIPLFKPSCSDLEVKYVTEVLRSGWWGMGPKTEELEDKFAEYVGTRYAVATNSGTMALEISLAAMNDGDHPSPTAIVPALTFVSTGLAALHAGYHVRFADVEESTLCLDWRSVSDKLSHDPVSAVIPVWYSGTVGYVPDWAHDYAVEDCAHAGGAARAGKQGRAACWSFQAVKNIAAGDGGMITTNDSVLAAKAKALRWCGIDRSTWDRDKNKPYGWDYNVVAPGYKAHMNDITAALALAQLERVGELNKARRRMVHWYMEAFAECDWLKLPVWDQHSSWHLFCVRVQPWVRAKFIEHMLVNGISAGVHYKPISNYKIFGPHQRLPVTDMVWEELVTLPLFPDMTEGEQATVIKAVKDFIPE